MKLLMLSQVEPISSRYVNPYYTTVSHTVLIVSDGLISGVQFSLNQLYADLSQVCVRVPFFGIFFTTKC